MKAAFAVAQKWAKVAVTLTRDSVCAGDDFDAPHQETRKIVPFLEPADFVRELLSYLPIVAGTGHHWTCVLNRVKIAEIREVGVRPLVREIPLGEVNSVHFVYHSASF